MKRKTKQEVRKMESYLPTADYELHYQLRVILTKDGPCRFSKLRNDYGISPLDLERQAQAYPAIFYIVETECGTEPEIGLHEGKLPSREDMLMRQQLVALVEQAAEAGVYLSNLHKTTAFTSQNIQRLLSDVEQVEAISANKGRTLYRWKEGSRIQDLPEPADQLPEPIDHGWSYSN
jgi:hypothetical protein